MTIISPQVVPTEETRKSTLFFAELEAKAGVLGPPTFRDVHAGQHLDPGDHGLMECQWNGHGLFEHAVDPHEHPAHFGGGHQVNV